MGFIGALRDFIIKKFDEAKLRQKEREDKERLRLFEEEKARAMQLLLERKRKKASERNNWEKAKVNKSKIQRALEDVKKNRTKIISDKEFNTPLLETKADDSGILSFKGKKFLFCREGIQWFEEDFVNEKYYDLIVDGGYLAREHKERHFIQRFHRWVMKDEVDDFAIENECPNDGVQVHHKDLTTTNNKIKNLKPMLTEDHKKLHIRLKFDGSDDAFDEWYEDKSD